MDKLQSYYVLFSNNGELENGIILARTEIEAQQLSKEFAKQQGIIYIAVIGAIDENGVLL